jgi:periplasmic protein CpxP/Spy
MKKPLAVITLFTSLILQSSTFAADSDAALHENMQNMQTMMGAIKTEQDPEKRKAMMMEHMESMHKSMGMMGQNGNGSSSGMDMGSKMEGMEKRMEMMQMMMTQMMEHETEEAKDPTHEHDHTP